MIFDTNSNFKYFALIILCGLSAAFCSANDINSGADAVIENAVTDVVCNSLESATATYHTEITILNNKGCSYAVFAEKYGKTNKLTKFSGVIYDAAGKVIKKIKKSDLRKTEYSQSFADDAYTMYFDFTPTSFPIKVMYEWTETWENGVISFPAFIPQTGTRIGVKKAAYKIVTPQEMQCRYKVINSSVSVSKTTSSDGSIVYSAEMSDLQPVTNEDYTKPLTERLPIVYFSPSKFQFLGTSGDLSSWQEYGKWQWSLIENRNELPQELKTKLTEITADCTTNKEKISKVYDFLGETTRYVSIQLGISGWQPEKASQVYSSGFGDCKGLTNYMRAMLDFLGIKSIYTVIHSGGSKRLISDFPNMSQTNHVILCVPQETDSLWIECTNSTLPLGYVHNDIAGHDAILVKETGGEFVTLPDTPGTKNMAYYNSVINIKEDGTSDITFDASFYEKQFENNIALINADNSYRKQWIKHKLRLTDAIVSDIAINNNSTDYFPPEIKVNAKLRSNKFTSISGQRLFVPVNLVHNNSSAIVKNADRKDEVVITTGYCDIDTVNIVIPENYIIESCPKSNSVTDDFAEYTLDIMAQGNKVTAVLRLTIHSGVYPPESFERIHLFFQQFSKNLKQKVVLRKRNP